MTEKDTWSRILNAAESIIREKGIDGLSMREISARIGLSAPAAYRHFAGKDEIVNEIIVRGYRKFITGLQEVRSGITDPKSLLEATLRYYLRFWTSDRKGFAIMTSRSTASKDLSGDAIRAGSFGDIPQLVSKILQSKGSQEKAVETGRWVAVSLQGATASIIADFPPDGTESATYEDSVNKAIDSAVRFLMNAVRAAT
jgi:AcrR family transcriptional regulator